MDSILNVGVITQFAHKKHTQTSNSFILELPRNKKRLELRVNKFHHKNVLS